MGLVKVDLIIYDKGWKVYCYDDSREPNLDLVHQGGFSGSKESNRRCLHTFWADVGSVTQEQGHKSKIKPLTCSAFARTSSIVIKSEEDPPNHCSRCYFIHSLLSTSTGCPSRAIRLDACQPLKGPN
jgi:hypothetical protein